MEHALQQRLAYEQCAAECIAILCTYSELAGRLDRILEKVRDCVCADRAYIFMNENIPASGLCMTQVHESCAQGVTPQIDNPELKRLPYKGSAPTILPTLQERRPFAGIVAKMAEPERSILAGQNILSLLIVPIFSNNTLWGFIGFDDCTVPRQWQDIDIRVLQIVADGMGAEIDRWHDKKRLEKKAEEQRMLLDTIGTQIWYLSDVETYGMVNQAHADFLGRSVKDISYRKLEAFLPPDVAAVCKDGNKEVFETCRPVYTEEWTPDRRGEQRLLEITKTPKLDENGEVAFVVCAGRDITDLRTTEEALRYRLEFEQIVSRISSDLIGLSEKTVDAGINRALAAIGAFTGADRAYVFLYRNGGGRMDNTHEWCARGIGSQIASLQNLRLEQDLPPGSLSASTILRCFTLLTWPPCRLMHGLNARISKPSTSSLSLLCR